MNRTYLPLAVVSLPLLDQAIFASVSAMGVFALFSPLFWGLS